MMSSAWSMLPVLMGRCQPAEVPVTKCRVVSHDDAPWSRSGVALSRAEWRALDERMLAIVASEGAATNAMLAQALNLDVDRVRARMVGLEQSHRARRIPGVKPAVWVPV